MKLSPALPNIANIIEADRHPSGRVTQRFPDDSAAGTFLVTNSHLKRLMLLISSPKWGDEQLIEILALYNDAAYVYFTRDRFDDEDTRLEVSNFCRLFFWDAEVALSLRTRLTSFATEGELEDARVEFIRQLNERLEFGVTPELPDSHRLTILAGKLDRARRQLLAQLGLNTASLSNAPTAMEYLLSQEKSEETRVKLARAWMLQTESLVDQFIDAVNQTVASNLRDRSRRLPRYSHHRATNLRDFLDSELRVAAREHRLLASRVKRFFAGSEAPLSANLPRYKFLLFGEASPTFDSDSVVNYAMGLARAIDPSFDLRRCDDDLYAGDRGIIALNLWREQDSSAQNAFSENLRNRMDWGEWKQRPVAYVQCNFRPEPSRRLSFQSATTLLHEIGHAVHHILTDGKLSYTSGVFYSPSELRECMSVWFEKRLIDDTGPLSSSPLPPHVLTTIRGSRTLLSTASRLERTVAAAIDFRMNVEGDTDFTSAYSAITAEFSGEDLCTPGGVAAHFSSPHFLAHPGSASSYVVGDAFSRKMGDPANTSFDRHRFDVLRTRSQIFQLPPTGPAD